MSRNLDPALAAGMAAGNIMPVILASLQFKSGTSYVWSGVGDLVWNSNTFKGVGALGNVGSISEGSDVKADGTTVSLSGLSLSQILLPPGPPVTPPPPPVPVPPGQSMAWAYATIPPTAGSFASGPTVFNDFLGCSGAASGDATSGAIGMTNGDSLNQDSIGALWSGYALPLEIPSGATITGVYPVVTVSSISTGGGLNISCFTPNGPTQTLGPTLGTTVGQNMGTLSGQTFTASVSNTLPGPSNTSMAISFIGLAVYYEGEPLTQTTLLYESQNDIQMGAPAKIWFGLMANGALLGAPYLVFSGLVDQPNVGISPDTINFSLALENRLVNLQRASQRRYTSADQHLAYPDDTAFNWVEQMNDLALRWG